MDSKDLIFIIIKAMERHITITTITTINYLNNPMRLTVIRTIIIIMVFTIILMYANRRNQQFRVVFNTILIDFSVILILPTDLIIPIKLDFRIILDDNWYLHYSFQLEEHVH